MLYQYELALYPLNLVGRKEDEKNSLFLSFNVGKAITCGRREKRLKERKRSCNCYCWGGGERRVVEPIPTNAKKNSLHALLYSTVVYVFLFIGIKSNLLLHRRDCKRSSHILYVLLDLRYFLCFERKIYLS